MELLSTAAQQRAVRRVLHQGMLEQIVCVWRTALAEQQTSPNKTTERGLEFWLWLAQNCSQQGVRELAPDGSTDLRQLLGGTEPVKSRHQRGMQACRHCEGGGRDCRCGMFRSVFASRLKHRLGHLFHKKRNAIGTLNDILSKAFR